jgi:5-methylcytosine-specific restriction endonuclease McrA
MVDDEILEKIGFIRHPDSKAKCIFCFHYHNRKCIKHVIFNVKGSVCERDFLSKKGRKNYDVFNKKIKYQKVDDKPYKHLPKKKKRPYYSNPGKVTFYDSREWRSLRVKALLKYGRKCCLCGRGVQDNVVLHVDHIQPRSKRPDLELSIHNLQILCADCNLGKSNNYSEKWR